MNQEIHPTAVIINDDVEGKSLEITFVEDYKQGEKTNMISTMFIDMSSNEDEWDALLELVIDLIDEGLREPSGGSGMFNRTERKLD